MKLASLLRTVTFNLFLFLLLVLSYHNKSYAQSEDTKTLVKVSAQGFISNEGRHFFVVSFKIKPHWHTYWKNPGDAGTPTTISFEQNGSTLNIPSLEWPAPKKFLAQGDLQSFGHSNHFSVFYPLETFEKVVTNNKFTVTAKWVACKNLCIPSMATLGGKILNGKFIPLPPTPSQEFLISSDELNIRLENLPKESTFPDNLDILLSGKSDGKNSLTLKYSLTKSNQSKLLDNIDLLTPFPLEPFEFKREKIVKDAKGNIYGQIKIDWDGIYLDPPKQLPTNGKFDTPYLMRFLFANPISGKIEVIEKEFSSFSIDFSNPPTIKTSSTTGTSAQEPQKTSGESSKDKLSFFHYLLFAFIGGLILNLMPCVLPVISLKLFGLVKHRNAPHSVIFKHNMFYSAGVLFTFVLLALTIVLLKTGSESVGWGFHLQSPTFVAAMIVILFVFSLNLFGLFEIKTPGGKHIGNWTVVDGMIGDFSSGILATILATPCSAPFLGPALAFAFASSTVVIFGIFLAVGFGLAFPFIVTGFVPQLIAFLPSPGKWMKDFKHFLGLTLVITTLWLIDIFLTLTQASISTFKLNVALALTFFAFFLYKHITKRKIAVIAAFLAPILLIFNLLNYEITAESAYFQECETGGGKSSITDWQKWSPDRLEKLKSSRQTVFIDFTAKWCLTCKVNKKMVLDTKAFREVVQKYNLKLLRADWTKRDPLIGEWLLKHEIVGVPAYFIQKADGKLVYLGETLSIDEIEGHLAQ